MGESDWLAPRDPADLQFGQDVGQWDPFISLYYLVMRKQGRAESYRRSARLLLKTGRTFLLGKGQIEFQDRRNASGAEKEIEVKAAGILGKAPDVKGPWDVDLRAQQCEPASAFRCRSATASPARRRPSLILEQCRAAFVWARP